MIMAAQVLLLVAFLPSAFSARYEWNDKWQVLNNGSLEEFKAGQGYGSYRIIVVEGKSILSDKGTCALAFLNFRDSGNYYLSIMLGAHLNASGLAIPIWTANRNYPVTEGARLYLKSFLFLFDSEDNQVWNPPGVLKGLELLDYGNMILYDRDNNTVWQSFDNLTDVLMPNQHFKTGDKLTSNLNEYSMAEGVFSTVMEAGGVAFYLQDIKGGNSNRQPYVLKAIGGTQDIDQVRASCPSYAAVLMYKGNIVTFAYEKTVLNPPQPPCYPALSLPLWAASAHELQFARLETSGDLVVYGYDPNMSSWSTLFNELSLFQQPCKTPLSCGAYGICQANGTCRCINESTKRGSFVLGTTTSKPCSAPSAVVSQQCTERDGKHQLMYKVEGVRYFTNLWTPVNTKASLEDCKKLCINNCSCAALFYQNMSSSCYFVRELLGSIYNKSNPDLSAYLKFQHPTLTTLNPKAKIITIAWAIATAGAGALLISLGTVLTAVICRRRSQKQADMINIMSVLSELPAAPPQRFSYKFLSTATKGFSQKLGDGGFGSVYAGTSPNGSRVAVKRLDINAKQGHKQFVAEVVSLASVSHVNIVKLRGYCIQGSKRLLVYEYMDNGSLDHWLFCEDAMTWKVRRSIALGTARGLAYLHEDCTEPILHLDIKPQNILLDANFVAKVADFGMSKLLTNREITQVVTGVRGTPGYLAPEWLVNSIATKKCDVYSYGMVLLELISGRRNFDVSRLNSGTSWYYPAWAVGMLREGKIKELTDRKLSSAGEFPTEEDIERLVRVAFWCIQDNPAARPSMSTVVQMLEGHSEVPEPPLTFHFSIQAPEILNISTATDIANIDNLGPSSSSHST